MSSPDSFEFISSLLCLSFAVEGEEDVRVRAVETRGRDSQEEDESKKDSPLCWGTTLLSFSCSSLSLPPSLSLSLFFSLFTCLLSLRRARTHLFVCDFSLSPFQFVYTLYMYMCVCVDWDTCIHVLLGLVILCAYLNPVSISVLRFSFYYAPTPSLSLLFSLSSSLSLPLLCHRFISPRTLSR